MTTPVYVWSKDDAEIIKAAWASDAGRLALTTIVNRISNLHGISFSSDQNLTAFNEGRRFVGHALMLAINTPLDKLVRTDDNSSIRGVVATATERAAAAASKPASAITGSDKRRR